jgi:hypothetical protein
MRNDSFPLHDPAGLGIFLVMARALAPAPFQPDFRARYPGTAEPPRSTGTTSGALPRKIGLLERLDRWFWAQQQRDVEAYLAQSVDVHDLEQRMRNLERSAWHRYN